MAAADGAAPYLFLDPESDGITQMGPDDIAQICVDAPGL
jgi:hypothetical protein